MSGTAGDRHSACLGTGKGWTALGVLESLRAGPEPQETEPSVPAPIRHLCRQVLQRLHLEQKGDGLTWGGEGRGPARSLTHTVGGGGFRTAPRVTPSPGVPGAAPHLAGGGSGAGQPLVPLRAALRERAVAGSRSHRSAAAPPPPTALSPPPPVTGTQVALAVQLKGLIQDL